MLVAWALAVSWPGFVAVAWGQSAGAGSGASGAARRPLAVVVDAGPAAPGDDAQLAELAKSLGKALIASDQLEPVADSTAIWLREPFADEDQPALNQALAGYKAAQAALDDYRFADAAASADAAEAAMLAASPHTATELRAELRVVHGIALLADKPAEAAAQFVLAQRLAPNLILDPARYLPEVVDAYTAARAHAASDERVVDVGGSGRVWIDGREVGAAPGTFAVAVGLHIVQLAGPERITHGREIDVKPAPAAVPAVAIEDTEASQKVRIYRGRTALARAADPVARAGAMTALAKVVQVDDALLLSRDGSGALVFDVWRASSGFLPMGARPVGGDSPSKLLDVVAPPRPKATRKLYQVQFVVPPLPRWQQPRYFLPAGGLAAALLVAAVYLIATHEGTVGFHDSFGTDPPWSAPPTGTRR